MNPWPLIRPSGDRAVLIEFENRIDPEINRQVRSLALAIEEEKAAGIEEILPAYRTLMVAYDPLILDAETLQQKLRGWLDRADKLHLPPGRVFTLPTIYGGEHGPDLGRAAERTGLPAAEVIRIFSETKFLVYFIGFICGLAYLGGLPEVLRVPRLDTPRTFVPGGSVGMAGGQANAISTDQPSGFNYIGRTFVSLYDPRVFPPIPFVAGDEIRFQSVSEKEALKARGKRGGGFRMKALQVLNPGVLTTVQDLGRKGFMKYGTPASGAADPFAAMAANLLAGNDPGAAVLETALFRLELLAFDDLTVAVTGGNLTPTVNGGPMPMWQSVQVRAGARIAFRGRKTGFRAYLAVRGGFAGEEFLHSRSVFVRGLMGRPLRAQEILSTEGNSGGAFSLRTLPAYWVPDYSERVPLRVILGPQEDRFTPKGIETFLASEYRVSAQSDRMGYRLEGPKIEHVKGADIISECIARGAIQVPGDGLPILLLWDAQVSGGYTKIANVIGADVDAAAQIIPGETLRFREVSLNEAHEALRRRKEKLEEIRRFLTAC